MSGRRRPMVRIGSLLPDAARQLGLEDELRLARAATTWAAIVAEHAPAASGLTALVRLDGTTLVVDADAPIVAQELNLHGPELLEAFSAAPGGQPARQLHVRVARAGPGTPGSREAGR